MNLLMQTPAADGLQLTPFISSALSFMLQDQYDKKLRLFRRVETSFSSCSKSTKNAFEDLEQQIIKCDLNSAKSIE
ncbi:8644_t:CDS:2 [Gigaspora margarita]|uniref:8644_t:CDS:1 n=1 Tax=Gigaspora margarita TaxID=4874 RepID=A0ABN7U994_GIGMA|nr:8644_t:CDS:2 [Gigaspora margarita]